MTIAKQIKIDPTLPERIKAFNGHPLTREANSTSAIFSVPMPPISAPDWRCDEFSVLNQDGDLQHRYWVVYDHNRQPIFTSHHELLPEVQEANVLLAAAAPHLLTALRDCLMLLKPHEGSDTPEGLVFRKGVYAMATAMFGGAAWSPELDKPAGW